MGTETTQEDLGIGLGGGKRIEKNLLSRKVIFFINVDVYKLVLQKDQDIIKMMKMHALVSAC